MAGAVLNSPNERIKQQYMSWLWNLLLSPAGRALVKLDGTDVEDAEELCLAEVQFCVQSVFGRHSANESIEQWPLPHMLDSSAATGSF